MNKFLEGIKFGFGLLFVFGFVSLVYAAGWHVASEVLPGKFADGNFSFNGSIGVGTSNPGAMLDVLGGQSNPAVRIGGYSGSIATSTGLGVYGHSEFENNLIVGKNLGIGTDTPTSRLDVNGSIISSNPIVGRWRCDNDNILGFYEWDVEVFNSVPSILSMDAAGDGIVINKEGYYQINVNALQKGLTDGQRGDVYLYRNSLVIARSLETGDTGSQFAKHVLSIIEYFNVSDKIRVESSFNGETYCDTSLWSTLEIYKLN